MSAILCEKGMEDQVCRYSLEWSSFIAVLLGSGFGVEIRAS